MQADISGFEQVADLIPLQESSLALIGTLWTVSSDSKLPPIERETQSISQVHGPDKVEGGPASWAVFVTGLNQAIEQSQRDVEEGVYFDVTRFDPTTNGRHANDEALPWEGPILPVSQSELLDGIKSGRPGISKNQARSRDAHASRLFVPNAVDSAASIDDANLKRNAITRSGRARPVALASVPTASIAIAFGAITGWFWTQRQRWLGVISQEPRSPSPRDRRQWRGALRSRPVELGRRNGPTPAWLRPLIQSPDALSSLSISSLSIF